MWSFHYSGPISNVKQAVETRASQFTGDDKTEFESAKPHLFALIDLNNSSNGEVASLNFQAFGGVSVKDGVKKSACFCNIQPLTMGKPV